MAHLDYQDVTIRCTAVTQCDLQLGCHTLVLPWRITFPRGGIGRPDWQTLRDWNM